MSYIVFDLEWNQSPYGKNKEDPVMPFEIIEIGAVKLDASFRVTDTFHETVRPVLYRKLHFMTRSVIHMNESDFNGKRTFPEVFADFVLWCGADPMFCSWGPGDLTELQRNVRWHMDRGYLTGRWPFRFPLLFRDIQKIFSRVFEDGKQRRSLEWAVEYLKIAKTEEFHNAFSDASYTARILQKLPPEAIERYSSVDTYITPAKRSQEVLLHYDNYVKFISKSFPEHDAVMRDRVVRSLVCNVCGQKTTRLIRWFSDNGRNYYCVGECPQHGLVKGKSRVRQNAAGMWFAVKTTRLISDQDLEKIREKQEALRRKRKQRRK